MYLQTEEARAGLQPGTWWLEFMGHHEDLWEKYVIFYKKNPLIIYPKLNFEEEEEEGSAATEPSRQKES